MYFYSDSCFDARDDVTSSTDPNGVRLPPISTTTKATASENKPAAAAAADSSSDDEPVKAPTELLVEVNCRQLYLLLLVFHHPLTLSFQV